MVSYTLFVRMERLADLALRSVYLLIAAALCLLLVGGCSKANDQQAGAGKAGDSSGGAAVSGSTNTGGGDPVDFVFDREAVLGDWPTEARVLSSSCDPSWAPANWRGSGTTEISHANDLITRVRRMNGWTFLGRLDEPRTTLETTTVFHEVNTEATLHMEIVFTSLSRFVATTTFEVPASEKNPEKCAGVIEDVGIR